MQVRWGRRTTSIMSCNTNMSKLLVRWAFNTYIWYLLPQLLWCMPLHVMFLLPTTSLHLVRSVPCCTRWLLTTCTAILAKYMYAWAYPTEIPSVGQQNNTCCCWCMRTWECVQDDQWVCTRASKHVGTCVLLRYATNAGYGLVSVTFVGLIVIIIVFAAIHSPFPLPIPSPTTLRPHPPCPLSQLKTTGWDSHPRS